LFGQSLIDLAVQKTYQLKKLFLNGKKIYIWRSLKQVHVHSSKKHQRHLKHLNRNKNRRDTSWSNKIKLKKYSHIRSPTQPTIAQKKNKKAALDKNLHGRTTYEQHTSRTKPTEMVGRAQFTEEKHHKKPGMSPSPAQIHSFMLATQRDYQQLQRTGSTIHS